MAKWINTNRPVLKKGMHPKAVREIFEGQDVHTLPVVDEQGSYIGLLHHDDFSDAMRTECVEDYVTYATFFGHPEDALESMAQMLIKSHEELLPIVDREKKMLGTITVYEVLDLLAQMAAFDEPGVMLHVALEDRPGALKEVVDVLAQHKVNILSILTSYQDETYREVFLKVDIPRSMTAFQLEKVMESKPRKSFSLKRIEEKAGEELRKGGRK